MRADRLLSLLMLLQTHGRMPACRLAATLEVSERTIYRDIDALSGVGIPVYSEPGRGGGFALLDSYRTSLTGLTANEVRALFMLSIPAPLAELGLSQDLRGALLKMAAALPGTHQADERQVRQRFYLDSVGWEYGEEDVPLLSIIHQAVWQDQRLVITYQIGPLGAEIEQKIEPYALVAKAGMWYLVYARRGALRVARVATLREARLLEEEFARPRDFDLPRFWDQWTSGQAASRAHYPVQVRVSPGLLPQLVWHFGQRMHAQIAHAGPPDTAGWVMVELPFESLESARSRILGFGGDMEVVDPPALRASVQDFARQILRAYRSENP